MLVEKCIDGFVKITIPEFGIVTYASDLEDAQVAISEAIELHRSISSQFLKNDILVFDTDLPLGKSF